MLRSTIPILLSGVAFALLAQPRAEPVSPQLLRGNTLVVKDGNFTISAPDASWRWDILHPSQPDPGSLGMYVCVNKTTGQYFLVTVNKFEADTINETFMKGFFSAIQRNFPDAAASFHYDSIDRPRKGSVRYTYSHTVAKGGRAYTYGYIVPTGRSVTIFATTPDAREPPALKPFAASLRVINEPTFRSH